MKAFSEIFTDFVSRLSEIAVGIDEVIRSVALGLFSGGHLLLEGVPGVGKTLLGRSVARLIQGSFSRIQFTPDLLPSDIIGTMIYRGHEAGFEFRRGPVFANVVLADEINRAPPKTQAALLEAMEERKVTVDNHDFSLPEPFYVIATMNPIELQGTYPLPEAQLDRFLMKVVIRYPDPISERRLLATHPGAGHIYALEGSLTPVLAPHEIERFRNQASQLTVGDKVLDYLSALIQATRSSAWISLGVSPRAGIHLLSVARLNALSEDRDFVIPDDLKNLVLPVWRHRVILSPDALVEGLTPDGVLTDILKTVPVPR
ncbi:MAG: AAA family ATPase [bacterium JZ-2024 1]